MYVHTHLHQPASKNAKNLSEQLVEVIRAAKNSNENLSYMDVCQATRLTNSKLRQELGGMSSWTKNWILIGALVGLLVAAVAFIMLNR